MICTKTAEPIEMPFGLWACMGPRNQVLDVGPDFRSTHGKGQFYGGKRAANSKVMGLYTVSCANKSSVVAEMADRLVTIGMGRKWGGAAVGAGSPLSTHLKQCGLLGRGLPLYQVAS